MEIKSLVKQYKAIVEDSTISAESRQMLLSYFKDTFPKNTKISFNYYYRLVPVGVSLLVLLFIFISVTGLIIGAKNTLPGNFLYPVKLGFEEARMIAVFDTSKQAVLRAEILTHRLSEAKVLAQRVEKGEYESEVELQHLTKNFTKDLQALKKQITQDSTQAIRVNDPFPEKELLATDEESFISASPDLPISDERPIFTVVGTDKLQALLKETKGLLARKDLATALLRIEEAEELTDASIEDEDEEESPVIEDDVEELQPQEESRINDTSSSVGEIYDNVESSTDFSIDTRKDETFSTYMINDK